MFPSNILLALYLYFHDLGMYVLDTIDFLYKLYNTFFKVPETNLNIQTILSFTDICSHYTQEYQTEFQEFITRENASSAIQPVFYNMDEYKQVMSVAKNWLELDWARRVVLENTPYGTVAMYYDAYKLAFSYFCDQRSVSYNVLNAVAMKYVRRFCCLDFFVDESIWKSPLMELWKDAEKKEEEEKRGKKSDAGLDFLKGAPFVSKKKPAPAGSVLKEEEKNKNKFVYIGNLQMHFTQLYLKEPVKQVVAAGVVDPVKARLSYKDFKKQQNAVEIREEERPDWTLLSKFPEE
jgi:hypothetical protein